MRSLFDKLNSTTVFATVMAVFFWLLSERGTDRVMVTFAFLLTFVALAGLFFAFVQKPGDAERE
jgi:energy-coupling factor transporter transmembrane protein EcfT